MSKCVVCTKSFYEYEGVVCEECITDSIAKERMEEDWQEMNQSCKQCGKIGCSGPPGYDYNCDGSPRLSDSMG